MLPTLGWGNHGARARQCALEQGDRPVEMWSELCAHDGKLHWVLALLLPPPTPDESAGFAVRRDRILAISGRGTSIGQRLDAVRGPAFLRYGAANYLSRTR